MCKGKCFKPAPASNRAFLKGCLTQDASNPAPASNEAFLKGIVMESTPGQHHPVTSSFPRISTCKCSRPVAAWTVKKGVPEQHHPFNLRLQSNMLIDTAKPCPLLIQSPTQIWSSRAQNSIVCLLFHMWRHCSSVAMTLQQEQICEKLNLAAQ